MHIHISPYLLPLASPSHHPYPTLLGGHKARSWSPVLCGCFPLAIYFTFGSVYMSVLLSHFVPAYPSPSPCPQVHSLIAWVFNDLCLTKCPLPHIMPAFSRPEEETRKVWKMRGLAKVFLLYTTEFVKANVKLTKPSFPKRYTYAALEYFRTDCQSHTCSSGASSQGP